MQYKLAIVDDDEKQRAYLSEIVNVWAKKNCHLLKVKQYAEANFDILFIDIEMSGFIEKMSVQDTCMRNSDSMLFLKDRMLSSSRTDHTKKNSICRNTYNEGEGCH